MSEQRAYETFIFRENRRDPSAARLAMVDVPVVEEYVPVSPEENKRSIIDLLLGKSKKRETSPVRQSLDFDAVREILGGGGLRILTLNFETRPISRGLVRTVLHGVCSDRPFGLSDEALDAEGIPVREFAGCIDFRGSMLLFCVEEIEYDDGRPYESRLKPLPYNSVQLERGFGVL
jgi:hypothetical protein